MRGLHPPKHKLSEVDKEFIKEHILKFQPNISHYRREHAPKRLYLSSELTCRDMYDDYKLFCAEFDRKCLSYLTYWREVKAMNISFAKLGSEECELCDKQRLHLGDSSDSSTNKKNKLKLE